MSRAKHAPITLTLPAEQWRALYQITQEERAVFLPRSTAKSAGVPVEAVESLYARLDQIEQARQARDAE